MQLLCFRGSVPGASQGGSGAPPQKSCCGPGSVPHADGQDKNLPRRPAGHRTPDHTALSPLVPAPNRLTRGLASVG